MLGGNYILDESGEPRLEPDIIKWAKWMERADRTVEITKMGNVTVSTVFLAIDHNFLCHGGAPILYETMIFGGEHAGYQDRYCTVAEAIEGHKRAATLAAEGLAEHADNQ